MMSLRHKAEMLQLENDNLKVRIRELEEHSHSDETVQDLLHALDQSEDIRMEVETEYDELKKRNEYLEAENKWVNNLLEECLDNLEEAVNENADLAEHVKELEADSYYYEHQLSYTLDMIGKMKELIHQGFDHIEWEDANYPESLL